MSAVFSQERFDSMPIVGILRGFTLKETLTLASISEQVGLKNLEITMNTEGVEDQIKACLDNFGDDLNIGAGTVTDMESLELALEAGAQFIVTPNVNETVIKACVSEKISIFSGAFTPTEIDQAWRAGATMVKIFPADTLGPAYLKAVMGPLNHIPMMPTGGVDPTSMAKWKSAGAKAYGVGGTLYNSKAVRAGDWDSVTETAKSFVSAYKALNN